MKPIYFLLIALLLAFNLKTHASPIVYEDKQNAGSGIGKGKHLVFIASDHEYRAEEALPMLARILAKHHGFRCSVVFGVDDKGHILAGSSNIPGTDVLKDADGMIIFTRFLNPKPEQMDPIISYLDRAGPVVGLRTSSHGFKIPADSPYAKYDFKSKVEGYEKGFGHQILGNTWVGHYGKNHVEGTQTQIIPEQKDHPILRGVMDNAFGYAGAYTGIPDETFTVLTNSQPLLKFTPDAPPNTEKAPMPSTWTRHYTGKNGNKARVFHSTQGASEDFLDSSYRRMIINGILWSLGLEEKITPELNIDFVGPYQPLPYTRGGHATNVKPEDLAGWNTPIMPNGETHQPTKPGKEVREGRQKQGSGKKKNKK